MFGTVVSLLVHLDLVPVLVCLLDYRQLGVWIWSRETRVGSVPGAVQHQRPLLDEPGLGRLGVETHLEQKRDVRFRRDTGEA